MKKHQISLDFSKPCGMSGGGYMSSSSPSNISISSRSSCSQVGLLGKQIRFPTNTTERLGVGTPMVGTSPPITKSKNKNLGTTSLSGVNNGDKTVCQYCGVSYLTIGEMRTLQATVKEQGERLLHYKEVLSENSHMKELIGNLRQTHHDELYKYEEEIQWVKGRCRELENQLDKFKIKTKHQDGTGDRRNFDNGDQAALIHEKMKVLESALRKVILNPQFRDKPETDVLISRLEEINRLIKESNRNLGGMGDSNQSQVTSGNVQNEPVVLQKRHPRSRLTTASGSRKVPSVNAIEVHDLRRENITLSEKIRNLTSDFVNSQDMHSALRETLDKLKIDNDSLHEEMNSLRVQFEESVVTNENLEAQLKGFRTENERLRSFGKETELRLRSLDEQNRILKNSVDEKLVDRLQMTLAGLKKQIQEHQIQTEKVRSEFQQKLGEAQRETSMEKERADSCLASSLLERQEVEKRWEERWGRHQTSLTEQLESLRSNYEKTLASVKGDKELLQKEFTVLREKYEKSKEAWEAYRKSLNDQVSQWKVKYEQKQGDLEAARQSKVEVELLYQEKSAEMESLHEIVREGCEERQELQKQVSEMKESFEEVRLQGQSCFPGRRSGPQIKSSILSDGDSGYCSFAELKEKNKTKLGNLSHVSSGFIAPPPTCKTVPDFYNPPPTAPLLSPESNSVISTNGRKSKKQPQPPTHDPHLFTIGKGMKQTPPLTPMAKSISTTQAQKQRPLSLVEKKKSYEKHLASKK